MIIANWLFIVAMEAFVLFFTADIVLFATGRREASDMAELASMTAYAVAVLAAFLQRNWIGGVVGVLWLAWWVVRWWRRRRKRKGRAPLGAKSRARIKAMVRTMKQRARPRGAVRPVPGGAW